MTIDTDILKKIKRLEDIRFAKDITVPPEAERIPTGSLSLDAAIGGGWPMGRIVTLWGPKGSTKSTLSLYTIKNAQEAGKQCLYIDAERTFDSGWAENIGVNTEDLLVYEEVNVDNIIPKMQEESFFKDIDVCVIDSISQINSNEMFKENSGAIGLQAKATKRLLLMLPYINPKTLIIVISQQTTLFSNMYTKQSWTGGNALDHLSSLIVGLHIKGGKEDIITIPNTKTIIGHTIRWKIDKTKISEPLLQGKYDFLYSGVIDVRREYVEFGIEHGIIEKRGAWFEFKGNKWQGDKNIIEALEDAVLFKELKNEVLKRGYSNGQSGKYHQDSEVDSVDA